MAAIVGDGKSWCLWCAMERYVGIAGTDLIPENIDSFLINVRQGYQADHRGRPLGLSDDPVEGGCFRCRRSLSGPLDTMHVQIFRNWMYREVGYHAGDGSADPAFRAYYAALGEAIRQDRTLDQITNWLQMVQALTEEEATTYRLILKTISEGYQRER
jgi:hypothetical protein